MNIIRKMTSTTQEKFRKELIKRDQSCLLSGLCHEVCEAAHLVNREWIKPSNKTLMFTPKNGLLLNSNLHKEFDMNFWTIDMNYESWSILQKEIDPEKTATYKCNIKLYPIGQKKFDTNMSLEIFKYMETGIKIPLECMPFVIKRNIIYKNNNISNQFTLEDIEQGLKIDFKTNKTKTKSKDKKKNKSSPEKLRKKRTRYTNDLRKVISGWMNGLDAVPDKNIRLEFCSQNSIDPKIFESRFSRMWKKYGLLTQ